MRFLLQFYRAGVVLGLVVLVHQQGRWIDAQRNNRITIAQARKFFPAANRILLRDPEKGFNYVTDAHGDTLGVLLTTSPQTDHIVGYSGPNNLLIALDTKGTITGVELLGSGDTEEHVGIVKRNRKFLPSFIGWKPGENPPPKVSAVSGATLTSYAIAESIQERLAGSAPSLRFPEPVTLAEIQKLFTNAASFKGEGRRVRVFDQAGRSLGFAARTSPETDNVAGYRGPTESLVGIGLDGRTVIGVRLRQSFDTASYVDQVRADEHYLKGFEGRTVEQLAALDHKREKIQGVSGATQTSWAVAEGLKRHFAAEIKRNVPNPPWQPKREDCALAAIIMGSLVMAFTGLRGNRWVRLAWQALLIGYVGLMSGHFLSLALAGGWAINGLYLQAAPGLVLLVAAAFVVPWATGRQIYCHQLCPHGALQQCLGLLGRTWRLRRSSVVSDGKSMEPSAGVRSPSARRASDLCQRLPALLLGVALLLLVTGVPFNLTAIEPFDAWVWRAAGGMTIAIAVAGLVASVFVPQAYCRFGCPTGALLSFIRSRGPGDQWGTRDWTALVFLLIGVAAVSVTRALPRSSSVPEPTTLHGPTMGTTWTVKIRDEVADPPALEKAIAAQYELAEQMTSHWRTNTDLSAFNRSETTEPFPVPWPVVTLARWSAEISRATEGAFDITVGPLVRLWGFGPAPRRETPPTEQEITALRPAVGWEKLEILEGQLRKQQPGLQIDLSAIAPGWANDQVAQLLEHRGYTNFLVESGGELRARGAWTIAIEHPLRSCTLSNESIGTSGTYRQNWKKDGRQYSHLIDPRAGRPITHQTVSFSVRHADCAHADAWGCALNVLGVEAGLPLAERLGLAAQFVVEAQPGKLEIRASKAWAR